MPQSRRHVRVRAKVDSRRLPDSFCEGAMVLEQLWSQGVLYEVGRQLQVYRQGGYVGLDIFVFLVLYFSGHVHLGLSAFDQLIGAHRTRLAALGERQTLPTHASVSRFLKAVPEGDLDAFASYLLLEASGGCELLGQRSVVSRDARGQAWHFFDLDPTSKVLRQRALPDREDLPAARRRASEARPGYRGRKRGEVKVTRTTLQHAGSGLWLGLWTSGSQGLRRHSARAIERVKQVCDKAGIALARALVRVDGEGGNTPFITTCQEAGVHYLTRSQYYTLLDVPEIRAFLNEASWYEVEDSGSGPRRQAAELGRVELPCSAQTLREDGTPFARVTTRLVVSRYRSEAGHGRGRLIEEWQYELYATDLAVEDYVAPEVVTLYYGRCGLENRFGQEDRELGLDRAYSYHLPGYNLACLIGLFVWNLRICWGVRLDGKGPELPLQLIRRSVSAPQGVVLPIPAHEEGDDVQPATLSPGVAPEATGENLPPTDPLRVDGAEGDLIALAAEVATPPAVLSCDDEPGRPSLLRTVPLPEVDSCVPDPDPQAAGTPFPVFEEVHEAARPDLPGGDSPREGSEPSETAWVPGQTATQGPAPADDSEVRTPAIVPLPGEEGSEGDREALPEGDVRQALLIELARQDWTRLTRYKQGWRFVEEAGGILCFNSKILTLSSVALLEKGVTGILRFRPHGNVCVECPFRGQCLRPGATDKRKEVILSVPAAVAKHIAQLFLRMRQTASLSPPRLERALPSGRWTAMEARLAAMTPVPPEPVTEPVPEVTSTGPPGSGPPERDRDRLAWELPSPVSPGTFVKPLHSILEPAAARRAFRDACRAIEVSIDVTLPDTRAGASPLYVLTDEARQHRRLSWTRRHRHNALPADAVLELDIQAPTQASRLLDLGPMVRRNLAQRAVS